MNSKLLVFGISFFIATSIMECREVKVATVQGREQHHYDYDSIYNIKLLIRDIPDRTNKNIFRYQCLFKSDNEAELLCHLVGSIGRNKKYIFNERDAAYSECIKIARGMKAYFLSEKLAFCALEKEVLILGEKNQVVPLKRKKMLIHRNSQKEPQV